MTELAVSIVPDRTGAGSQPYASGSELVRWRVFVTLGLLTPVAATLVALVRLWRYGPVLSDFVAFGVTYVLAGVGITAGYHRLFTHRSFEVPRWLRLTFAVLGSMSLIGPVAIWVATHRRHHAYADRDGDPHSPNRPFDAGPKTAGQRLRGFLHGYAGWLYTPDYSPLEEWTPDLLADPAVMFINRNFNALALLSLALPALITFAITRTWSGFWGALLWGGFVRVGAILNVTFFLNSITHVAGTRPFPTRDGARNFWPICLVTFGESWHNNHHAFPSNAMQGMHWWQLDPSGWLIRALELCGLATGVQRVSAAAIARRRLAAE